MKQGITESGFYDALLINVAKLMGNIILLNKSNNL